MPDIPLLTDAQWRAVEPILPVGRRDRSVISAICFRESAGIGLRDLCEAYGVTRTRISDWTRALEADGSLPRILSALRLEPAGPLMRRRGGVPSLRRHGGGGAMLEHKLNRFSEQLGHSPRQKARRGWGRNPDGRGLGSMTESIGLDDREQRPAKLTKLLRRADAGDVFMMTRLDRLAPSTRDLLNILDTISKAGAGFKSLWSSFMAGVNAVLRCGMNGLFL
jgi:hypothetical protein